MREVTDAWREKEGKKKRGERERRERERARERGVCLWNRCLVL